MSEIDSVEHFYAANPLAKFSVYTHLQVEVLARVGQEIRNELDAAMAERGANAEKLQQAWGLFWLWVLGAYEVVRTMSQAGCCFDAELNAEIVVIKRYLAKIRMPFAKQEYAGDSRNPQPIAADASISGWNPEKRDMSYSVEGTVYSVRDSLEKLNLFFSSIEADQILADHRQSYVAS